MLRPSERSTSPQTSQTNSPDRAGGVNTGAGTVSLKAARTVITHNKQPGERGELLLEKAAVLPYFITGKMDVNSVNAVIILHILKGPLLNPLSDLYFSSRTPVEQHRAINYPKKTL